MKREHTIYAAVLIATLGILLVFVAVGVVFYIKSGQVNPDAVKQQMATAVKEISRKYKPDQVVEIDGALEAILIEHEPVKKYVAQMYANIEREHAKVHQIAADLKKADKEVIPFLTKYEHFKAKPDELRLKAQVLYDEGNSLKDSFGLTVHGEKLSQVLDELRKILQERARLSDR